MKPLIPPAQTEFEKSLQSDRDHAARGRAEHRQPPLAVSIPDLRGRVKELEAALKAVDMLIPEYVKDTANTNEGRIRMVVRIALKGAK